MRAVMAAAIAVSGCSGGCGHPQTNAQAPGKPAADELRVLSYNVNFGLAGDMQEITAVGPVMADVVFLQETNAEWEAAFVDTFSRRYPHHRFDAPESMPAGGMGVLSRFPIESIEKLPSHGGFFFAWRVVLQTNLGRVQVLNVHLRPPISDGGSWLAGYFSTRENRLEEIEYHLARIDRALPTLVVGDFNEEGDGLALQRLGEVGFDDAIAHFAPKQRTWEWKLPSGITLHFQLDHVLYDARLEPLQAHVVEAGRSDHKPVWADFALVR
jgi:endonuclease/exonuclease/phosphatase (EEP) superfamily protein YafD